MVRRRVGPVGRSAVTVPVRRGEPVVAAAPRAADPAGWGVPRTSRCSIPFVPPGLLDDGVLARLADAVQSKSPPSTASSPAPTGSATEVLCLAPEPAEPFRLLTAAVWAAFPEHPPYGGELADLVPHLTVGARRRPR